mmetsp:Transcript_99666/g.287719  ORF Transcript_99666/g.287719 Transcript_99666/m.287719 type:complete len:684 (+) Transcript_99666:87-2138(+)
MVGMRALALALLAPARVTGVKTAKFETSTRAAKGPKGFSMTSRIYVPYGPGDGYAFGMGAVEKTAWDEVEKYLYTVSEQGSVNVVDYADPTKPVVVKDFAIDLTGKKLTDVAICASKQMLFVAHGADDVVSDGRVRFYSAARREPSAKPAYLKEVTTGPLPDMISPNGECTMLAVANEGEGRYSSAGGLVDPPGSVSLVKDLTAAEPTVMNVPFTSLGSDEDLISKGVHLPLSKKAMEYWDEHSAVAGDLDFASARASYTPAMNLEPEYLGWALAGDKVFVGLQENSAIVTVDVPPAADWGATPPRASRIDALGLKDWSPSGTTGGIDLIKDDGCVLKNFPGYHTMRQPDSIAVVSVDGVDYVLTANEGDDKEYGGFEEKMKANDVINADGVVQLAKVTVDATALANYKSQNGMAADSKRRVSVGSASIDYSTPSAPKIIDMVGFGGRGISIWKPTESALELVWDSGSQIEVEQCKKYPLAHNGIQDEEFALVGGELYKSSSAKLQKTLDEMNDPDVDGCADRGDGKAGACPLGKTVDSRSPKDGAAPEAIVAGVACGRLVAVTATEKQGTAFVYDISDIKAPELLFVEHLSPISLTKSPGVAYATRELGEIDSEGMVFLEAGASPSGKAAVLFGGAWSGTVSMWEFECEAGGTTEAPTTSSAPPGTRASLVALAAFFGALAC